MFVSEELLGGGAGSAPLSSEPETDGLLNTVLNKDNLSVDKLNILTMMSYFLNGFILSPTSGVNTHSGEGSRKVEVCVRCQVENIYIQEIIDFALWYMIEFHQFSQTPYEMSQNVGQNKSENMSFN